MEDIKNIQTDTLIDMLAKFTADYSTMLKEGYMDDELTNCQLTIDSLQSEITARKNIEATISKYKFVSSVTK